MPFAVAMFLDPTSAKPVCRVWRDLADTEAAPWMHESGARPHVTLGVWDRLDVEAGARLLEDFAAMNAAPAVRFSSIGVFATDPAVVFLAPVVTADLLALHDRFHRLFPDVAAEPQAYYLPNQWVPHCTLAMECPPAAVPRVIDVCGGLRLPLEGRSDEVGIVEFRPIRHGPAFRFAGG